MSLFKTEDINNRIEQAALLQSDAAETTVYNYAGVATKSRHLINKITAILAAGHRHIDFVSAGELSLHTLIEFILQTHAGSLCDVYLSTWAIKDAAARAIIRMKDSGQINNLYGVFDYRINSVDGKHFKPIAHLFTKYALTKNHAKVVIVDFEEVQYCILTSANLSNNPRIEAGYISTNGQTAKFHKGWMMDVLNGKKIN